MHVICIAIIEIKLWFKQFYYPFMHVIYTQQYVVLVIHIKYSIHLPINLSKWKNFMGCKHAAMSISYTKRKGMILIDCSHIATCRPLEVKYTIDQNTKV